MSNTENNNIKKERFPDRGSLILHFLKGSKSLFIISVIFSALTSVFALAEPRVISFAVDSIIGDKEPEPGIISGTILAVGGGLESLKNGLWKVAAIIIVLAIVRLLCKFFFQSFNARAEEKFVRRMRDLLYEHIIRLPLSWHGANMTGDIIQRCTSDVDTVRRFLAEQLTNLVRITVLIILAICFMVRINPILTVFAVMLVPVIIGYSTYFYTKISDQFEKVDTMEGRLSAMVQENLTGVRVVRAFGRERYEKDRFEAYNEKYINSWVKLMRLLTQFWATGDLSGGLQALIIFGVGTYMCVKGNLTAGEYIAFVSYNAMMIWPVRMLGRMISEMGKAGISIDRIRYIMNSDEEDGMRKDEIVSADMTDTDGEKTDADYRKILSGDIVFEGVSFEYPNSSGGSETITDVSFTIPAGSTVGIIGGTGSGKSTLMYLLDRLFDVDDGKGKITIGGVDIREIPRSVLRSYIGIVLQEPYLFSGTLAENISITTQEMVMSEVTDAVRMAALTETVEKFSKGYDTYVGERGVTLSGGQKQRTAIAQMLIRKTPIQIFDDSLSAVDADTDRQIRAALREKEDGATTIIIAHRISTLMHADRIFVIDEGRLAESGTHDELVALGGIYAKVYDLQNAAIEKLSTGANGAE